MPTIIKIHGFERGQTAANLQSSSHVVQEVVLVETDSPLTTWKQLRDALPAYGTPGSTTGNPLQLTFTLNHSRHPDNSSYRLVSYGDVKRHRNDSQFWIVPLTYSTEVPSASPSGAVPTGGGGGGSSRQRLDQRIKKPDSPNEEDQEPIINPVDRPPQFSSGYSIVQRKSLFNLDNKIIIHTNGLPLTEGVTIPVGAKQWKWVYNVAVNDYKEEYFDTWFNKCNSVSFDIKQGGAATPDYTVPAKRLKFTGLSVNEVYETPAGSDVEYHYVRVSVTFSLTRDSWNTPPLSLHTKARIEPGAAALKEITVNERGGKSDKPWPLKPDGTAVPWNDRNDTSTFGKLQADGADLVVCEEANLSTFFNENGLTLPRVLL